MPDEDAVRWDARYRLPDYAGTQAPRRFLVENAALLPTRGLALDVAMGMGGSAGFLLERGLRVIGVDISSVAVRAAKARLPALAAVIADLTRFSLPPESLDVILNFYYLDRALWPLFQRALRPGGLLFVETLTTAMLAARPDLPLDFLLETGELRQAFNPFHLLAYREGWMPSD